MNSAHRHHRQICCFITKSAVMLLMFIYCFIAESTGKVNETSAEENQEEAKDDKEEKSSLVWVYILLAILLIVLIAGVILYLRKRITLNIVPQSLLSQVKKKNSDTNEINKSRS